MDNIYNIGIIGTGIVAKRIIEASKKHPKANVKAIYDINMDVSKQVGKEYNLEVVDSYFKLLEDSEIDIIYLAVPPKFHYEISLDIFKANKHFLCEKPLANSTNEVLEMAKIASKKDNIFAMNFPLMYTKGYEYILDLLNNNELGEIKRIEFLGYFEQWPRFWQQTNWINSKEQGGFTREVITHYIQLIFDLFGKIEDVNSFIEYPSDQNLAEKSLIAKAKVKDIPILISGVSDIGLKEQLMFKIIGSKKSVMLKNWSEIYTATKASEFIKVDLASDNNLNTLLDNLFNAIEKKENKIVDFKVGSEVHLVIEQLLNEK